MNNINKYVILRAKLLRYKLDCAREECETADEYLRELDEKKRAYLRAPNDLRPALWDDLTALMVEVEDFMKGEKNV